MDKMLTNDSEVALVRFQQAMENYQHALRQASSRSRRLTFVTAIHWVQAAHEVAEVLDDQDAFKRLCDAYVFILVSAAMECQKQAIRSGNIGQIHDDLSEQIQLCAELLVAAYRKRGTELPLACAMVVRGFAEEARALVVSEKKEPLTANHLAGPLVGVGMVATTAFTFSGATEARTLDQFLSLMAATVKTALPLGRTDHSCYRDENDIWQMIRFAADNASFNLVWFLDSDNTPWRWVFPKKNPYTFDKSRVALEWAGRLLTSDADLLNPNRAGQRTAAIEALGKAVAALQKYDYSESKRLLKALISQLGRQGIH